MSAAPYSPGGWRDQLAEAFPLEVARSLKGHSGTDADTLRAKLASAVPGAVVESLAGRGDASANELRDQLWSQADVHERAISLTRLNDSSSRKRREKLLEKDPAVALANLKGLAGPGIDEELTKWAAFAPKVVLKAIGGRSDEFAHQMRDQLVETGREVIDSVRGLDDEQSWNLRTRFVERWPSTVAWSCAGLTHAADARVQPLLATCRESAPGDLFLKRRMYQLEVLGRLDDLRRKHAADDFDA